MNNKKNAHLKRPICGCREECCEYPRVLDGPENDHINCTRCRNWELLGVKWRRQMGLLCHLMRGLEKKCSTGKIDGKKGSGRPRRTFMNGLVAATGRGCRKVELLRMARESWIVFHNTPRPSGYGTKIQISQ